MNINELELAQRKGKIVPEGTDSLFEGKKCMKRGKVRVKKNLGWLEWRE